MNSPIQAVIFNWRGCEANAVALEQKLSPLVPTQVINSDEHAAARHPHWMHLGESAYFSAQWNAALKICQAPILFHIQADAYFDRFSELFARASALLSSGRVGIYEPYIDFSDLQYDLKHLRAIDPGVFSVPITDCTCWFVSQKVLKRFAPVNLTVNRYGWGIPPVAAAIAGLQGMTCLRDYNFKVLHPKRRGYSSQEAVTQRKNYLNSLTPKLRNEAIARIRLWNQFRPGAQPAIP